MNYRCRICKTATRKHFDRGVKLLCYHDKGVEEDQDDGKTLPSPESSLSTKQIRWWHGKKLGQGREYMLMRNYGIDLKEFDIMKQEQDNGCAICGRRFLSTEPKNACVDHDHETGEVRGILCFRCNSGLGMFRDDIKLLARAIVYLESHDKSY